MVAKLDGNNHTIIYNIRVFCSKYHKITSLECPYPIFYNFKYIDHKSHHLFHSLVFLVHELYLIWRCLSLFLLCRDLCFYHFSLLLKQFFIVLFPALQCFLVFNIWLLFLSSSAALNLSVRGRTCFEVNFLAFFSRYLCLTILIFLLISLLIGLCLWLSLLLLYLPFLFFLPAPFNISLDRSRRHCLWRYHSYPASHIYLYHHLSGFFSFLLFDIAIVRERQPLVLL